MRALALLSLVAATAPSVATDQYAGQVLAAVNRARTQPDAAGLDMLRFRATFRGRVAYENGSGPGWSSAEGVGAVDEAATVLRRQSPLGAVFPSAVLARAARAHAAEQARTGAIGHTSAAGRGPGDRVRTAGGDGYVSEVIAYGFDAPERAVRQLLVDDGVPRRGHRVLMLSSRIRYAGVGCAEHPRFRTVCVIDFAETPDGSASLPF